MYWDGILEDKKVSPKSAILVADGHSKSTASAIAHINTLKDKLGKRYDLQTQDHAPYDSL